MLEPPEKDDLYMGHVSSGSDFLHQIVSILGGVLVIYFAFFWYWAMFQPLFYFLGTLFMGLSGHPVPSGDYGY